MNYPPVKRAHIVSATYLESFAIDHTVTVRQVVEGKDFDSHVDNVAIRRYEYRRERPHDGSKINDIEWLLAQNEGDATPILRSLLDRWPLCGEDKLTLSLLFAYQMIRGPRWAAEYDDAHPQIMSELVAGRTVRLGEREIQLDQDTIDGLSATFGSKSHRLLHIVQFVPTLVSLIGTMHWTLVEFAAPVIVTSDHPVFPWPGGGARRPAPVPLRSGLLNAIEIRLPISPTHALLMTWSDKPDTVDATVRGNKDHARRFNAFTIAAAERQWFRQPGAPVLTAGGSQMPLSPELVPRYSQHAAAHSQRRERATQHAHEKIGRRMSDREASIWLVGEPDVTRR